MGAANLLACHKTTRFIDIILRGGWEAKSMSRMFIYIEGVLHPISCAGRALAGWRDSHTNVFQPECCFITQSNETQVSNLIMKLFQCSVRDMHTRGKLWPLALCLFATLLMYLPEMRSRYPNHGVSHVLMEKSQECDIRLGQLLEWSKMVKVRFDHRNMEATLDEGQSLIPVLLERIVILEKNAKASHEVCTNLVYNQLFDVSCSVTLYS